MINRKALTALLIFLIPLILAIVFLALFSEEVPAQEAPIVQEGISPALKGLRSVVVLVTDLDPSAVNASLSKDQIKTDVELRLRRNGITVDESLETSRGTSYLYIQVDSLETEGTFVSNNRVSIRETVEIIGPNESTKRSLIHGVVTWSRGYMQVSLNSKSLV